MLSFQTPLPSTMNLSKGEPSSFPRKHAPYSDTGRESNATRRAASLFALSLSKGLPNGEQSIMSF